MNKILHLNLYKKWFLQILNGEKKEEYRDATPYWTKRLFDENNNPKKYDHIIFRNGYRKDAPEIKVEFLGVNKKGKKFVIKLGKIMDKNKW